MSEQTAIDQHIAWLELRITEWKKTHTAMQYNYGTSRRRKLEPVIALDILQQALANARAAKERSGE